MIFHDDFEVPTDQSPPLRWTMWCDEKYKDRANDTPDTAQAFNPQSSFRIHHPAHTSGYIVSPSEFTIQPKADNVRRNCNIGVTMHRAVRLILSNDS